MRIDMLVNVNNDNIREEKRDETNGCTNREGKRTKVVTCCLIVVCVFGFTVTDSLKNDNCL